MKFDYILISGAVVGLIILLGAVLKKLYDWLSPYPYMKKKNQYGTFRYDPQSQMFKAEINWCCQNTVTAYWGCADHSSESGLQIQRYFNDLMIYSPMWDQKVRSHIVNDIFTIPASIHDDIRKTISKTKLYEQLIMDFVAIYQNGMVEFGMKLHRNNDQYYILVLAYLNGEIQIMDMQKIKE